MSPCRSFRPIRACSRSLQFLLVSKRRSEKRKKAPSGVIRRRSKGRDLIGFKAVRIEVGRRRHRSFPRNLAWDRIRACPLPSVPGARQVQAPSTVVRFRLEADRRRVSSKEADATAEARSPPRPPPSRSPFEIQANVRVTLGGTLSRLPGEACPAGFCRWSLRSAVPLNDRIVESTSGTRQPCGPWPSMRGA